jgi:hypothetical protein
MYRIFSLTIELHVRTCWECFPSGKHSQAIVFGVVSIAPMKRLRGRQVEARDVKSPSPDVRCIHSNSSDETFAFLAPAERGVTCWT